MLIELSSQRWPNVSNHRYIFAEFRAQDSSFADYLHKEASVNPTNVDDVADDFEAQLFPQMQGSSATAHVGEMGVKTAKAGESVFGFTLPVVDV